MKSVWCVPKQFVVEMICGTSNFRAMNEQMKELEIVG